MSRGWRLWLQWGGNTNNIILFSLAHFYNRIGNMWFVTIIKNEKILLVISRSLSISQEMLLKRIPEYGAIGPTGVWHNSCCNWVFFPLRRPLFSFFPLKTKNGGFEVPAALPQEMIVVVPALGLTTAWVLLPFFASTLVGVCSVETPVSSILYKRWGLSSKFFFQYFL